MTAIVLVSFHTGPSLFKTIDSVLRQTDPFELVIVDNGNPPTVTAKLQSLALADARCKLISGQGNIGFAHANNLGVKATGSPFLLLLNPDCILEPDTLFKVTELAQRLSQPFMLGARILNEDGSDQRGARRELLTPLTALVEALPLRGLFPKARLNQHTQSVPQIITAIPAISGAFMFLSRKDFDAIGGFDEGYFLHVEDLDLCLRFTRAGGTIYFLPEVTVQHIGGTSEASSDFIERHKRRGFIRYFHKNFASDYPKAFLWSLDLAIWMRYLLLRGIRTLRNSKKN